MLGFGPERSSCQGEIQTMHFALEIWYLAGAGASSPCKHILAEVLSAAPCPAGLMVSACVWEMSFVSCLHCFH